MIKKNCESEYDLVYRIRLSDRGDMLYLEGFEINDLSEYKTILKMKKFTREDLFFNMEEFENTLCDDLESLLRWKSKK